MDNYKKVLSPLRWLTALVTALAAASSYAIVENAIDELQLERITEERLTRDLGVLFGHERFVISVDFAFPADGTVDQPDQRTILTETVVRLPGLPNSREVINREIPVDTTRIIGTNDLQLQRFLEENGLLGIPQDEVQRNTEVTLIIDLNETADKEAQAVALIERRLRLNRDSGEQVDVIRTAFGPPPAEEEVDDNLAEGEPGAELGPQAGLPPGQLGAEEAEQSVWEKYMPEIMLALFLLICVIAFLFFIYALRKMQNDADAALQRELADQEAKSVAAAGGGAGGAAEEEYPDDFINGENKEIKNLKQELVSLGLGHPKLMQNEAKNLWSENQVGVLSALAEVMGRPVFQSVFGDLDGEQRRRLDEYTESNLQTPTQKRAFIKSAYDRIVNNIIDAPERNSQRSHAFRFLDRLNDSQILYLLKNENVRVRALVLSQVAAERSARLLRQFPEEDRAEITYELVQFESFPVNTFRDIAENLSRKAESAPSFKNVLTDGVSIVIDMLDNMNLAEEELVMAQLQAQDPDLYSRLRERYYTFSDITYTPMRILSELLPSVEQTILAQSLINSAPEVNERVMEALPERMARSLMEEVEFLSDKSRPDEIDNARRILIKRLRLMLNAGRFTMKEVVESQVQGDEDGEYDYDDESYG